MLFKAGLGEYRDQLVQKGLRTMRDLATFDDSELESMGMSTTQRFVLQLMSRSPAILDDANEDVGATEGARAGAGGSTTRDEHETRVAAVAVDLGPCTIENACDDAPATVLLPCCGTAACAQCVADSMVFSHNFLRCPNPACNGDGGDGSSRDTGNNNGDGERARKALVFFERLSRDLFQHRCCCCAQELLPPATNTTLLGPRRSRSGDSSSGGGGGGGGESVASGHSEVTQKQYATPTTADAPLPGSNLHAFGRWFKEHIAYVSVAVLRPAVVDAISVPVL